MSADFARDDMRSILLKISNLFTSIYVLPETGRMIADKLERAFNADLFHQMGREEFADKISEIILATSNDAHLTVEYDPTFFEQLIQRSQISDEERNANPLYQHYNCYVEKVERLAGNIGYLKINGFVNETLGKPFVNNAILFLQYCDAIIIDLRENEGGRPELVHYIISHFSSAVPVQLTSLFNAEQQILQEYFTTNDLVTEQLIDVPVYILTSSHSFSAAEDMAYTLQALDRATVVGETTKGGAHAGGFKPIEGGFYMWISTIRAVNPITNDNWEGKGVIPDIQTSSDGAFPIAYELALNKVMDTSLDPEEVKAALSEFEDQ